MSNNEVAVIDDKEYWSDFYKKHPVPSMPSPFALFVGDKLNAGTTLLELGCGNGRDSVYFSEECEAKVVAVDQCESEIAFLNERYGSKRLEFRTGDFTRLTETTQYDSIYSRFTLHAVDKEAEQRTLKWAFGTLADGGRLFIEVRSTKDPLRGVGTALSESEYVTDHYRRFVDFTELKTQLEDIGFALDFEQESNGLAVYKEEDPVVIRIVARR